MVNTNSMFPSSIVSVERNIPFSELGENVEGLMSASECMDKANLDWGVDLADCYMKLPNGQFVEVPNNKVPYRTDLEVPFNAVGNRYVPFQNKQCFDFLDNVIDDFGARYDTAGAFDNGAIVFLMLRLSNEVVIGDDKVVPYLTMINSHNGQTSLKAFTTPIRITCSNTMRLAIKQAVSSFSFKHTKNASSKIQQARRSLEIGYRYYDEFSHEMNKLVDVKANVDDLKKMLEVVYPVVSERTDIEGNILNEGAITKTKLAHNKIIDIFENGDSATVKDNAWGMLNSVNDWELWTSEIRNTNSRFERQAKSIVSGRIHPITDRSFSYLKENYLTLA